MIQNLKIFPALYLKGGGRGATTTPGARIRTTTTLPPSEYPKTFLPLKPGDQDIAFSFTFQWVLIPTFLVTFWCIRHLVSTCFFCLMAMIWQIYNHFKQLKCESLSLNFVLTLGLIREQKQTLSKSSWIQISRFLRLAASCPVTITEFAKTDDNIDKGFYILS